MAVTNIYPTARFQASGTFVEQQVSSLRQVGLDVEVLYIDRLERGTRAYRDIAQKLLRSCESFRPDVVHSMYGGVMADRVTGALAGKRATVVSFCGSDLLGERLSGILRRVVSGYGVLASHRAARRANAVVVKSANLMEALPNDIDRARVHIIPNGVNLQRFRCLDRCESRKQLGWKSDALHILFPANTGDPVKRYHLAEAAIGVLRRLGIQCELHKLQKISHEDVPVWINASDVLLLTSLQEGSPNIVKETLACDVPVVSVDVGDVKQRIHGIVGCHLATADPADLAAKLQLVYLGPRRVEGRLSVQPLSTQCVAERIRNLYCSVLSSGGTGTVAE